MSISFPYNIISRSSDIVDPRFYHVMWNYDLDKYLKEHIINRVFVRGNNTLTAKLLLPIIDIKLIPYDVFETATHEIANLLIQDG